jgi:hypothetical protein
MCYFGGFGQRQVQPHMPGHLQELKFFWDSISKRQNGLLRITRGKITGIPSKINPSIYTTSFFALIL